MGLVRGLLLLVRGVFRDRAELAAENLALRAVWVAVLFFLSEWESPGIELIAVHDSVAHFLLYTVLGFTLAWERLRGARYHHGVFVVLGIALGMMDEFHQSFVPGRTPAISDVFADTAGVIMGYALFVVIFARWLDSQAVAST